MEITVDLTNLKNNNLTPSEYIYLYLLNCTTCEQITLIEPSVIKSLEEKGFIKITDEGASLRMKGIDLFRVKDKDPFLEFWNTYPVRGGTRILRAVSSESKLGKKCREKYEKLIKNKPELHNKIVACLNKQLELERFKLQYMQEIDVWLNQQTWEKYEHLLIESKPKEAGYGSTLI